MQSRVPVLPCRLCTDAGSRRTLNQELSRTMAWGAGIDRRTDYERASPSAMCNISQHKLEPIILEAALRHGAQIRFNSELVDLRQDREAVTAKVRDRLSETEYEICWKYLIGADGGRSIVASKAGFEFEGQFNIGEAISVWLDADLTKYTAHRSGAIAFITPQSGDIWMSPRSPRNRAIMRSINNGLFAAR